MMYAAVLFMTGILYTAVGFNIYTETVRNFTDDDPLFGQTIIQSMDGVFVPSPTSGDIFSCTEENCIGKKVTGVTKGLRPIASVTLNENKDQLLVCNQFRTRNSSTEYFNANCTNLSVKRDLQTNGQIDLYKLALQALAKSDTSNKHQDSPKSEDQSRKKRDVNEEGPDEDEDEDAGTEIAFVLDGSGSIEAEDFEKAKNFISIMMTNIWKECFSCIFAVVQFGRNITTELSLQESNDTRRAQEKVMNIKQTGEITKTASALHHVLTNVFVPENGSNKKAKKKIVLLSDGEMQGDSRNLKDVLHMKEMEGIDRYAVGVGKEVLGKVTAINQMIEIAGSEERFFNVSNYAALTTILDSLEKSIIGIEGIQKGAGFEFQLAEAGFSSHFTREGSILFGAVGAYDWSGGFILRNNKESVAYFNATQEEPRFSYLGYSVTSAYTDSKTLYISGAPRYNLTGAVFIFNGTDQYLLQGDQVGSYFGSVLLTLDINNDKKTDYLLVGAPHFHVKGEEGKVLVYKMNQGKFEKEASELCGLETHMYARFGSAIADIGDIDGNSYSDVAVGAPLEADNAGSVYIYNGFENGINRHFSQRITPSDFGMTLVYFGQAVSAMASSKDLLSVGSQGAITVFKIIPVISIRPEILRWNTHVSQKQTEEEIPLDKQNNDESSTFDENLQICFTTPKGDVDSKTQLQIEYHIDLDSGKEQKRLFYVQPQDGRKEFILTQSKSCTDHILVKYKGCSDCFSPIKVRVNFTLTPSNGMPKRILDLYNPTEAIKEITFQKECSSEHCQAVISLKDSKLSNDILIIGSSQTLDVKFKLQNTGDNSYMTTLTLTYPEILSFKKSEGASCENKNENHQIVCILLGTIFRRNEKTDVTIAWQPINRYSEMRTASITAVLKGGNNGTELLDNNTYSFAVKHALKAQLIGSAKPQRLNITEGEKTHKQPLNFTFQLVAENPYNAKINLTITFEKQTHNTDLIIERVEPKNCSWPSNRNVDNTYQIVCTHIELQQVTIMAQTYIHDVIQDLYEKITAKGEITFDESIYDGNNIQTIQEVDVSLIKLTVVTSTPLIIGSSIGGFLLLIFIIIILIKCGFFRRSHKVDSTL